MMKSLISVFYLTLFACAGMTASAAQIEDRFDNAAYDGNLNTTLWQASSDAVVGTDVLQNAAADSLTLMSGKNDGSALGLISKNLFQFSGADLSRGINIQMMVKAINITADSGGGRDMNFMVFLTDTAAVDNNVHFFYPGASMVYYLDDKGNNGLIHAQQWSKSNTMNQNGWMVADRPLSNVTFPCKINIYVNERYSVLTMNDKPVFVNSNLHASSFPNGMALRIFAENQGTGRGNVEIDDITVSDAGAADIAFLPKPIPAEGLGTGFDPNGWDGAFSTNQFYLAGCGPWGMAAQGGGKMVLTAPNANYEESLLGTRDVAVGASDKLYVKYVIDSLAQASDPNLASNTTLTVTEGPNCFAYFHYAGPAFNVAMIKGIDNNLRVLTFSKARGASFAQGGTLIDKTVAVTFPLTVELQIDKGNYELFLNGVSTAAGTHAADFVDRMAVQVAARNEGGGSRTLVTLDKFNLGVNGAPDVPVELSTFSAE